MPLNPAVVAELERILGPGGLVLTPEGRLVYECDMHTFYKGAPDAVALPTLTEQVQAIVGLCRRERVPIVPRGSGTGLIGGAMAPVGGVMVGMNRMTRILEVDLPNRCATVQPGLINLWLTKAVEKAKGEGEHFASPNAAILASEYDAIDLRAKIKVLPVAGKEKYATFENHTFETTVGRLLFNTVLPADYPFVNETITKKVLARIASSVIVSL